MLTPLRLLIVGTGGMANTHATYYKQIPGVELVGGVDVRPEQLVAFNEKHGIPNAFDSVEKAIAWGQFDAASNVTSDRFHYMTTLPLLAAGKHVLCEKPLALNAEDAFQMAKAAAKAGVVNAVNFTYRSIASMEKAAEMIREGTLGEVRFFEASYLQSWLHQAAWGDWRADPSYLWRLSGAHGSHGALGDIGVHMVDFATHIMGSPIRDVSCRFAIHEKAPPDNRIGEYVFDVNDTATMQVSLSNGALGTISSTRVATGHGNYLQIKVCGTKGALEVLSEEPRTLRVCLGEDISHFKWQTIECPPAPLNFQRFVATIRGEKTLPAADFARGAEIQKVLDVAEESARRGGLILSI